MSRGKLDLELRQFTPHRIETLLFPASGRQENSMLGLMFLLRLKCFLGSRVTRWIVLSEVAVVLHRDGCASSTIRRRLR